MAAVSILVPDLVASSMGSIYGSRPYIFDASYNTLFPMSVATYKYDPTKFISYTGTDPDYYPEEGAFVVPEVHAAVVSGHDLDGLELSSSDKVVITTNGSNKALEVSTLGIADPLVVDTTLVDAGTNALILHSDAETRMSADSMNFTSVTKFDSSVSVDNASDPTFRFSATEGGMVVGTGVLDETTGAVSSGSFLQTTATGFEVGNDSARMMSEDAADATLRFEASGGHEFFVGTDAATQAVGTGAIHIGADKVTIRKDVDLQGTINSIATDQTSLQVEDQVIHLAYTDDAATQKRDVLLSQSKTGITIDTVPGDFAEDSAYMSGFKGGDGSDLFVDSATSTIDVDKALSSGAFAKEFAYYINEGVKSAGARTPASRLAEPYWNVAGGSLRLSHTVPNGDGLAKRFGLAFRITDGGDMEMVRVTNHLAWNEGDGVYEGDSSATDTAKVIARYSAPISA